MTNAEIRPQPPFDKARLFAFGLIIIVLLMSWMMWFTSNPIIEDTVEIIVPKNDWKAYQYISSNDINRINLLESKVPSFAITNTTAISGFMSVTPLSANQPFTVGQVIPVTDETLVVDKLIIAVEGRPALAMGGKLEPGAVVTAWAEEDRISERVLILGIQRYNMDEKTDTTKRYVVILLVSPNLQGELITAANDDTLSFSIKP